MELVREASAVRFVAPVCKFVRAALRWLDDKVILEEFQAAIRVRHRAAVSEPEHDSASAAAVDFA